MRFSKYPLNSHCGEYRAQFRMTFDSYHIMSCRGVVERGGRGRRKPSRVGAEEEEEEEEEEEDEEEEEERRRGDGGGRDGGEEDGGGGDGEEE